MNTRIQKWGNSLAVRIPNDNVFAKDASIEQGSEVDLTLEDGKLVISPIVGDDVTLASLLEGITPDNLHGTVDTGPPVGREAW